MEGVGKLGPEQEESGATGFGGIEGLSCTPDIESVS